MNNKMTLEAKDMTVIISSIYHLQFGIFFYKSNTDFYPNYESSMDEIHCDITSQKKGLNLSYYSVNEIIHDHKSVFRNYNNFDRIFHGRKKDHNELALRGDIVMVLDLDRLTMIEAMRLERFREFVSRVTYYEPKLTFFSSENKDMIKTHLPDLFSKS